MRLVSTSRDPGERNPITGIAGCCACAASGHANAAPRTTVNSLRRTFAPALTAVANSRPARRLSQERANLAAYFGASKIARSSATSALGPTEKIRDPRSHVRFVDRLRTQGFMPLAPGRRAGSLRQHRRGRRPRESIPRQQTPPADNRSGRMSGSHFLRRRLGVVLRRSQTLPLRFAMQALRLALVFQRYPGRVIASE
jgi:hypothetical protein